MNLIVDKNKQYSTLIRTRMELEFVFDFYIIAISTALQISGTLSSWILLFCSALPGGDHLNVTLAQYGTPALQLNISESAPMKKFKNPHAATSILPRTYKS